MTTKEMSHLLEKLNKEVAIHDFRFCRTNACRVHGFGVSGKWSNLDPEAKISQALETGAGPTASMTILQLFM
ncbi:hypothetical protein V6N13_006025 [Hibiscus sabdariffa]